ncbi:hypothetical protein JD844_031367 [Phrynosoma platyrhinos]|uniref:Transmembrane protein 45B n=1 Tax=Phrynosoma platyrhinos TaxID=52577 RepID=A0ABQ7T0U7_PHRPL|nr:hypothetical protein JD844_031367 [Phrynosoma platyrhinos]
MEMTPLEISASSTSDDKEKVFIKQHTSGMGNFLGHVLSGTLFLLLGILWSIKHPLRFYGLKSKHAIQVEKFIGYMEFLEWGGMIFFCSLGAVLEQYVPGGPRLQLYNEEIHKWVHLNLWQHSTMHVMFVFAGVAGVFIRCKFQVPLGMDYFLFSLALFIEGLCFEFREPSLAAESLDKLHLLSSVSSSSSNGVLVVWDWEGWSCLQYTQSEMLLFINFFFCLFIQTGFVLYPPWGDSQWDPNDQETRMLVAMSYSWHYEAVILYLAIIYGIVYWYAMKLGS